MRTVPGAMPSLHRSGRVRKGAWTQLLRRLPQLKSGFGDLQTPIGAIEKGYPKRHFQARQPPRDGGMIDVQRLCRFDDRASARWRKSSAGVRALNETYCSLWRRGFMGLEYALLRTGPLTMAPGATRAARFRTGGIPPAFRRRQRRCDAGERGRRYWNHDFPSGRDHQDGEALRPDSDGR